VELELDMERVAAPVPTPIPWPVSTATALPLPRCCRLGCVGGIPLVRNFSRDPAWKTGTPPPELALRARVLLLVKSGAFVGGRGFWGKRSVVRAVCDACEMALIHSFRLAGDRVAQTQVSDGVLSSKAFRAAYPKGRVSWLVCCRVLEEELPPPGRPGAEASPVGVPDALGPPVVW